jgi:hypothetical protein
VKIFFNKRKNSAKNPDIYNEVGNFDMFSYSELMKKSVDELNAMLSDDSLFPLDETENAEIIERICDVIIEKENVPKWVIKKEAWNSFRRFKKKYINSDNVKTEIVEVKKHQKHPLITALTALAAAAAVVLIIYFPARSSQLPTEVITDLETTATTIATAMTPETFDSLTVSLNPVPAGYTLKATGTINYNDKSEKTYAIYTSGEKIFFISLLTNTSVDLSSPSDNQIDPFDIFSDANMDDSSIMGGDEVLITQTDGDTQIIIYGDITEEYAEKLSISLETLGDKTEK